MKKTRETLSLALTAGPLILGIAVAIIICMPPLDPAFSNTPSSDAPMAYAILYVLIACLVAIIAFIPLFLLSQILGKPTYFNDHSNYVESYAITDEIVLPHQETQISHRTALITTTYYIQYSYCELEAFYRIMKRRGSLSYELPALELPTPFGKIWLEISKGTTKRLLERMSSDQYVVLSNTLGYSYTGENLMPEQETYVSRRDLRRIARRLLMHPNPSAVYPSIRVCCRAGEFVDVDQVKINEWADQLEKEGEHISITPRKEYAHGIYHLT